jgi:alkanesulfonate monooxygenase SsuD/methylene tetrahydromethanopterin reductase-like flavin-dependent oxidoreductase (luciferase family)
MRVGIMIEGQEGLTWERWWRLAAAAEDLGYESLCRSDHLTGLGGESKRPSLETWASLTALATRTRRIRFGPMVSPLTFYHPVILAKAAAAIDTLAGGRFDLGIGAGWNEHEHATYGVPFPPLKERMDRLECGARAIRALDAPKPVTLAQPYYALKNAETYPKSPSGRTRLVIGGRGEKRTLRVVAEFADEWNVTRVSAADYPAKYHVLVEHCKAVERNPNSIRRSLMIPLAIGRNNADIARRVANARAVFPALPDGEAAWRAAGFLAGPPSQVLADLDKWKAVGMERVLLQILDQEDIEALELFAKEVLPRL